jgi:coenzyme PQQ synthesis protein D (PqqD)
MSLDAAVVPRRVPVEDYAADGERLIYNAARDEASALNRTAGEIWELCDGTATIATIAAALGERYRVAADVLLSDVIDALAALMARGLVECHTGSPASPR